MFGGGGGREEGAVAMTEGRGAAVMAGGEGAVAMTEGRGAAVMAGGAGANVLAEEAAGFDTGMILYCSVLVFFSGVPFSTWPLLNFISQ